MLQLILQYFFKLTKKNIFSLILHADDRFFIEPDYLRHLNLSNLIDSHKLSTGMYKLVRSWSYLYAHVV